MYVIKCTAIGQGANKDVKPNVGYFGKRENFSPASTKNLLLHMATKGTILLVMLAGDLERTLIMKKHLFGNGSLKL